MKSVTQSVAAATPARRLILPAFGMLSAFGLPRLGQVVSGDLARGVEGSPASASHLMTSLSFPQLALGANPKNIGQETPQRIGVFRSGWTARRPIVQKIRASRLHYADERVFGRPVRWRRQPSIGNT
jgi:hypothetical protein